MVNIEHVRLLEERVQKVIARIGELSRENQELRERLGGYQEKISDLEQRIEQFSSSQAEIEAGILNALHQLDEVEDAVVGEGSAPLQELASHQAQPEDGAAPAATPEQQGEPEDPQDDQEEPAPSGPELDIF